MAKKNETAEAVTKKFSKVQILESKKYKGNVDLISALLTSSKDYTLEEVEKIVNDYLKGEL